MSIDPVSDPAERLELCMQIVKAAKDFRQLIRRLEREGPTESSDPAPEIIALYNAVDALEKPLWEEGKA